ncbi:uncharacterized protein LOC125050587 [Pieris napi]|uniref:uncharacterized protein LOC125050587 n=1 Tax=Pieris napi TaxID=78633 RepID=UPI001FB90D77|nr:uncharacterized protein LOC125050587 [Pieris napi]XP_047506490.1 uncharacterized protein LOC125050587 [Pieris napi]
MPPKTRGSKTLKISKENVGLTNRVKLKALENTKKPQRKVLSDKTNSASDDNANSSPLKNVETYKFEETELKKPQRKRKLPARYLENQALVSLCNSNNEQISPTSKPVKSKTKKKLPIKKDIQKSPLKTTSKILSNSILKPRPKRVCRIPSNLDGHSVSPIKYIPLQPVSTSTPVANKTVKNTAKNKNTSLVKTPSPVLKNVRKQLNKKKNAASAADTNNNGKKQQQIDKCFEKQIQSGKSKKIPSNSFRVFDDIKKSQKRNSVKNDPYEFTFDPDEEPPQKKKKKRLAKPRQPKPKTAIKGAYEKNLAKALATLKNALAMKTPSGRDVQVLNSQPVINVNNGSKKNDAILKTQVNEINNSIPCANNYNSVRIEDIAMDLQEPDHTLDYSPVNSPQHSVPRVVAENLSANKKDPLNLRDSLSFFDDQPVASSSMNASIRHPTASPWRIEFGSLPIKWPVNSYVKPNMTPAVESSYINFNDSKKKHVYTNIVPINDTLPQETSLKQTSIISFIKEVAERNAKKKMKSTPVKSNSLFEDISNKSLNASPTKSVSKNNSKESNSGHIDVIDENVDNSIMKTPEKSDSKKCGTFFGFDDTEEDQENVSPRKKDKRRALRPRSKVVLQEINNVNGPSRAIIPVSVKSKLILNSDPLNNDFEDPKLGLEPPLFPEKETHVNGEKTNLNVEDDDSNSVHLFEDIDLIHHYHQPPRKSYGKAKKVTFRQNSATDSDDSNDEEQVSDKEDNLDDLSFKLPSTKPKRVHKKKLTKKQKISKKEEQELENWATGFNSMCDDVEEFDLIVE